jgi:hypothetical protein
MTTHSLRVRARAMERPQNQLRAALEPVTFGFDDVQWDKVSKAVRVLGVDPEPALRERIEQLAALHIQRARLPPPNVLCALRDYHEKRRGHFARRLASLRRLGDDRRAPDEVRRLENAEASSTGWRRILDPLIAALPSHRPNRARDLFWNELLAVWCGVGGNESGVNAANFLIAVYGAMPREARPASVARNTVIEWLRVRSKKNLKGG